MKKLTCDSCNAKLKVDENNEYAYCEYCGVKYKLNEDVDVNLNLNIGDGIKESLKNGGDFAKKVVLIYIIIFVFILVIFFIIFGVTRSIFNNTKDIMDNSSININNIIDNTIDNTEEPIEEYKINSFNRIFEMYTGTKDKFFIEPLLDEVVTNNKTNKSQIISVVYNDLNTTDVEKIIDLKHSLEDKDYEVILNYDEVGFVSEVVIEDI